MTLPGFAEDSLAKYQWNNRPLVIALPSGASAITSQRIANKLSDAKAKLRDRDIVVINLSSTDSPLPFQEPLKAEETQQLRAELNLKNPSEQVFILFGKDGGEKLRQTKVLQLDKLFQLIDTMPMRKREMKSQ
jgi:lysophospholipase L1-like esterase